MRVLKSKREIQNQEKLRLIGLFCNMRVFWCNMRVFPISYKYFTHVEMLQSRYEQCKVEWLLSTWSDYVRYLLHHSLPFLPLKYQFREGGQGGWVLKFLEIG